MPVTGMYFSYDAARVEEVIARTYRREGIYYIRVWLNEDELQVGDDIMYVLIGGDIRPHVADALQALVGSIKSECVIETEQHCALPSRRRILCPDNCLCGMSRKGSFLSISFCPIKPYIMKGSGTDSLCLLPFTPVCSILSMLFSCFSTHFAISASQRRVSI